MSKHFITVPNNEEGKQFVKSLRKFLRGTPQTVKARGRGSRKELYNGNYWHDRKYRQDCPIDHAVKLSLYIVDRQTKRYVNRIGPNGRMTFDVRPTKWA